MNEQTWLTLQSGPTAMFMHVGRKLSARKRNLIAAACCRLVWDHLAEAEWRAAVELLECHADGAIPAEELQHLPTVHFLTNRDHPVWNSGSAAFVNDQGFAAWNATLAAVSGGFTGLHRCLEWVLQGYPRGAAEGERQALAEQLRTRVCDLFREIVGNPFRPWKGVPTFLGGGVVQPDGKTVRLSATARDLAESIHAGQAFDRLPILADALEESGVTDPDILAHCRTGTGHVRGCWALDVVRGKA